MHTYLKVLFAIAVSCFVAPQFCVASEATDVRIVIQTITATDQSNRKHNHAVTFIATDPVRVIKIDGENSLVESLSTPSLTDWPVWVPSKYLAGMSAFKPLSIWNGAKQAEVTAGDYSATYNLMPDGTFNVSQTESVNDDSDMGYHYNKVSYTGRLFKAGRVIWVRLGNNKSDSLESESDSHMFWLKSDGTLCAPSLARFFKQVQCEKE